MNTFVILPDQLFNDISVLEFLKDFDKIIIAEEPAYFRACSEGKIALVRAAMKAHYGYLEEQLSILTKTNNKAGFGKKYNKQTTEEWKKAKNNPPKLIYIDAAKILPRGDIFEYLTGSRTQIHMFRIAACYTWGSKPWDSTYYGLPIKFHESPGFLVPYCEIKYGDIFISGSAQMNKKGIMEVSGVTFGEFVHRFFKIAVDNGDTYESTRYDPGMTKIVTALPQAFSANSTISGFKKSHNAINVEEFSYEPSCGGIQVLKLGKTSKLDKTSQQRLLAKKYAKKYTENCAGPRAGSCTENHAENYTENYTKDIFASGEPRVKAEKLPRKVESNPEIITRVNSDDITKHLLKKTETCPDVKLKTLSRATTVVGGINVLAKTNIEKSSIENSNIVKSNIVKTNNPKTNNIKAPSVKIATLRNPIEKPISTKDLDCKNYPISALEANKLSIAFLNKFVRDYATYPTGAILELMFPLNMGLITPQMLLTHVLSVFGPQCKQNILLFLRDLLYREYLRCVYMTDPQFADEKYAEINSQTVAASQRTLGTGDNLEKMSILELTKLKKNATAQKFMGFASAKLPWYFYWCGFLQI